MMNWPVIKLILSHLIVFVLGGVSVIGIMGVDEMYWGDKTHRPRHPKEFEQRVVGFLTDRLHLTADQVAKLTPIISDTNLQMENLRKTTDSQAESILSDSKTKVEAILTPDQQTEFKKLEDERKRGPRNGFLMGR